MTDPVLFDLDGTLIDSLADIRASVDHVRAAFDLPPSTDDAVRRMVGDGARVLLERALVDRPDADHDAAWTLYQTHHQTQCTGFVQLYPGVRDRLAGWQAEGRPMAVVTNKPERFTHRILEHLDVTRFFPVVIAGDTTPERKPSPMPLLEALRRLGVNPPRGLMVGDGPQDLRAGKAAGLRTAAVLYGFHDETTLRAVGADEYWECF